MTELAVMVVKALAGYPWALVVLVLGAGMIWNLRLMVQNTRITESVAARIENKVNDDAIGRISELVEKIRSDQIQSNVERREQGAKIATMEARLRGVELDLEELKRQFREQSEKWEA